MSEQDLKVHISSGSIIKVILFVLLVGLVWFLRELVLVVLTAVVIASAIEPGIRFFVRHRLNRIFAVILMYLMIGGVFFSVIFFFIPPILNDAAGFLQKLPDTLSNLNITDVTHGLLPWGPVSDTLSSADLLRSVSQTLADTTGGVFTTLAAFFGGLTSFILIVVFAFYFSVQETGVDDFLRIVSPVKHQAYVLDLWRRSQDKIGKWMQGQLVLAVIVGVLLYLGLLILGMPFALLLAVLAAVFELIPVFGQILAAIPAVAIAFVTGGPTAALLVAGLYLVVQQFEAHLIYPVVVKKVVGIPPLLVILSLLVGFKLIGFLGVLLSVPIAGAIQELVSDLEKSKARALARGNAND
ncbi:MAG: AI-2E family transporter [Patescibacteria group bacterium]